MKKAFFSFDYDDSWKVQQVRQMGVITGENVLEPNAWETVKRSGDAAIKTWINTQMDKSDVLIVLIGTSTYKSRWVKYEIERALSTNKRILGIYIHNLKDKNNYTSDKGTDPFLYVNSPLKYVVQKYEPSSFNTYNDIKNRLMSI